MTVSIELPNPGLKLRADMYATVTIDVPSARGVLAVPENAVIHSGQRDVVVLDLGHGLFQARDVTLGVNGNGLWEVTHGLARGRPRGRLRAVPDRLGKQPQGRHRQHVRTRRRPVRLPRVRRDDAGAAHTGPLMSLTGVPCWNA